MFEYSLGLNGAKNIEIIIIGDSYDAVLRCKECRNRPDLFQIRKKYTNQPATFTVDSLDESMKLV